MGDLGDAYAAMSVQKCPCGAQPQGHPSGLCDACVAKRSASERARRLGAAPAPTPTPAPGLDLDAVERAERAMTPGPWRHGSVERHHVFCSEGDRSLLCPEAGRVLLRMNEHFHHDSDAAGIVALRNAAPALIAEMRSLRKKVERHGEHLRAGADAVRSANASTAEIGAKLEAAGAEIEALRAALAEATSLLRSAGDLFVEIQATDGEDEHKAITDGAKLSAAIAAALEAL